MDFEHVFNEMEISAAPFALCELNGRCDLNLNRQSFATLHYVLSGAGEIAFPNAPKIKVDRGTFVLIPAFQPHTLKSYGDTVSPTPDCQPAELDLINFKIMNMYSFITAVICSLGMAYIRLFEPYVQETFKEDL